MGTIKIGLSVGIAVVVVAALVTCLIVLLALSIAKAARCRKPKYFNIMYRQEHDTEFYRAHLVGAVERIGDKVLCLVEIHPEDAAEARAWTVREAELCGGQLLDKGRFYRYAFKEELYD